MWGKSIHINMHNCQCPEQVFIEPTTFFEGEVASILFQDFTKELLKEIKMKSYGYPTLEWFGEDNCEGYTWVQLIETSNLILHTTEDKSIYCDLFSCKDYSPDLVISLCHKYFKPEKLSFDILIRK